MRRFPAGRTPTSRFALAKKIEKIKAKEEADRLERERKAEERRITEEKAAKKKKKVIAITAPIVVACIAFAIVLTTVIIPSNKYRTAVGLMNDGKYREAISAFEAANGYKDAEAQLRNLFSMEHSLAAGYDNTADLKSDGTVVAVGNNNHGQCNVSNWQDIVAISAGNLHTVALRSDGTVVTVGNNEFSQCNVSGWRDIRMPY